MEQILPELKSLFDDLRTKNPEDSGCVIIKGEEEIRNLMQKGILPDIRFDLKIEAHVLKLAHSNNKLLSLSNSRTQILAHQVESTHRIINSISQRFLIADEVGLGKTIEAGLVLKEMIFRHGYRRMLIVCPASLIMQWQNELQSKFNEDFLIMDRTELNKIRKKGEGNPWETCDRIICSLDFIKSRSNMDDLKQAGWDIVIMDEAHRLRRDSLHSTLSYNAAEVLSKNAKSFLLLTATPFRGKLEELYYLVRLVDKNLLGPFQTFYQAFCLNNPDFSMLREKISSVIIRRTKKEVGGFTKRHAKTVRFELFPEERNLYDATTKYVVEEFNRAILGENRAVGFVMTVFQKLLDSSTFALVSALKKRRVNLSSIMEGAEKKIMAGRLLEKKIEAGFDDFDDFDEDEFDSLVSSALKKTFNEIKEEISVLDNLIKIGGAIDRNKKAEKLKELLHRIRKNKCGKVLIFTQFKTTQEYLKDVLSDFEVGIFNGSMDRDQKEEAMRNFRDKAYILISTEAGGEGRNMQFCNVLINYDLPWSPLKIEQRIGRIHRFGQPKDVFIYNFSTKDTVAERILEVLTKKLKLFEESIGTPDILLGQIEDGLNLNSIFMDMAAGAGARKINSEIESKLQTARENYEKLSELTVSREMDFNYDEYYRITLQDRQYSNNRIENFINTLRGCDEFVDALLSRKNRTTGQYTVKMLPDGTKADKQATFDSNLALKNETIEFLAFGNPVIDHLTSRCRCTDFGGITGIKFIRHQKKAAGMIFYYLVTLFSFSEHQELIPVFVSGDNSLRDHDLEEIEEKSIELPLQQRVSDRDIPDFSFITRKSGKYFEKARERIIKKIDSRITEMSLDIGKSITPEIEKVRDSYDKKIREFEEQLERQICQMKWFKKDMKSAITRTKNRISQETGEKEDILARYKGYRDVKYSIELINAGVLITQN